MTDSHSNSYIDSYEALVSAADTQTEPQRLLFVFCNAELPADATKQEKIAFEQGQGGALTPILCVDKALDEVRSFEALVDESRATGVDWSIVFVAAMSGRGGMAPSSDEAQQPLTMMVETIRLGKLGQYLPFTRTGELIEIG